MPDNLCGGTYRSAKRPEKRKLTYAERQQKKKERLFGKGDGEKMGSNEKLRASLEKGKSKKAVAVKPRVAQSQRGRDLRLEAALRRQQALEAESSASTASKKEESEDDDSEYETDVEEETVDVGGGHRMVRVEAEGQDEDEWNEFKEEMNSMCSATSLNGNKATSSHASALRKRKAEASSSSASGSNSSASKQKLFKDGSETEDSENEVEIVQPKKEKRTPAREIAKARAKEVSEVKGDDETPPPPSRVPSRGEGSGEQTKFKLSRNGNGTIDDGLPPSPSAAHQGTVKNEGKDLVFTSEAIPCSMCTMDNAPEVALCAVCGNVLDPKRTPSWKCTSATCADTAYSVSSITLETDGTAQKLTMVFYRIQMMQEYADAVALVELLEHLYFRPSASYTSVNCVRRSGRSVQTVRKAFSQLKSAVMLL